MAPRPDSPGSSDEPFEVQLKGHDPAQSEPTAVEPTARPRPARRAGARLRRVAVAFGMAALLCGGGALGWVANERFGERPIEVRRDVRVLAEASTADGVVPSVVGLTSADARQAFADSGAAPGLVSTVPTDQVGAAGLVIEQTPGPATRLDGRTRVRLAVSRGVRMPDLVGASRTTARERLERLGATVTEQSEYVPGATGDDVTHTVPAAGEPTTDRIALVYAEPESSVALADLEATSTDDCGLADGSADGTAYTQALVCLGGPSASSAVYAVDDRAGRLTADLALDDDAASGARVRVTVEADGRTVADEEVVGGRTTRLDAAIGGAREVRVQARAVGDELGEVVLADGAFYGSRDGIDALTGGTAP